MGIEAGNLIFVRGRSVISDLIRHFDEGEFSHVCIALSDTHIIEAEWNTKSVITPFHYKDYEVIDLKLTEDQKDKLIKKAIQLTGRYYDFPQLLNYVFKEDKWGSPKNLICSEMAYLLLKEVGIDVGNSNITPNQLYKVLGFYGY
ncbi:YiiX/YebB-like N1pC/P60 family cysteine hydrolase [Neobacillus vireti]|uniref:YiiX/YebB-like N1pC/P60 family cysteine hydrolase n=1 Tax=Neobacillus vireti TaxID=220686 RepID=UPI002FFEA249